MKIVEMAILSTDLAVYFKKKKEFVRMVENGEFGWQAEDKKECEKYLCFFYELKILKHFISQNQNIKFSLYIIKNTNILKTPFVVYYIREK